jgi:CRISPR-associated protein Csm5
MTVYSLSLETLSPLHIGSGEELRRDFDFVTDQNLTYVLNTDRILADKIDPARSGQKRYPLPGKLISQKEYQAYARYILRGTPRSERSNASVQACIKDVFNRPYIPGSSLKGALRTALAWSGFDEVQPDLHRGAIGNRRSWAGQKLEQKIFGRDPNHDLLRALQVSDLTGPEKPGEGLVLVNGQVVTKKDAGSPIELEALKGSVVFQGSIKVDEALFSDWAEPQLNFQNRQHWLEELMPRAHAFTLNRIRPLIDWFSSAGVTKIAKFYRQIESVNVGNQRAILQLGWGGGWDSKTFSSHLKENEQLFRRLLDEFRIRKGRGPVKDFPTSKRVVVKDDGKNIYPLAPFGWVLLTLEEQA